MKSSLWFLVVFVPLGLAGCAMILVGFALLPPFSQSPAGALAPTEAALLETTSLPKTVSVVTAVPTPESTATAPPPTMILSTRTPTSTPYPAPRGQIVFACFDGNDDEICLMNVDDALSGAGYGQLTHNATGDFYPSLSNDGQSIIFAHQIHGSNYEIFRMDTDGSNVTQLTFNGGGNFAPAYSPDDSLVAFTSTQGGGAQQIWVMDSNGNSQRQLTAQNTNADPTWSPDGRQIAFASITADNAQIWVMNADGSNPRQVTNIAYVGGRNSWSPDGRTLIFYAGKREDRNRNIFSINLAGGGAAQLTFEGDNLGPSFSPDGGWIAFTSYRDGDNDIYIMRFDGSNVINLTDNSSSEYQPRWGP